MEVCSFAFMYIGICLSGSFLFQLRTVSCRKYENDVHNVENESERKLLKAKIYKKATLAVMKRRGSLETSNLFPREYSTSSAIRFHLDYSNLETGNFAGRIRQDVLPKATAEIRRRFGMKNPVRGNLYLPVYCSDYFGYFSEFCNETYPSKAEPGYCSVSSLGVQNNWEYYGPYDLCTGPADNLCTRYPAQTGAPDSDFILYLSVKDIECDGSMLAYSSACSFDVENHRPLAGYINFCSASSQESDDVLVEEAVHHILHVLRISPWAAYYFVDETGNYLGTSDVYTTDYAGRTAVRTPTVLEQASAIYNCESVEGVPLEDDGGESLSACSGEHEVCLAGRHWEREHVGRDIMAASRDGPDRYHITPLTMALAAGSERSWKAVIS